MFCICIKKQIVKVWVIQRAKAKGGSLQHQTLGPSTNFAELNLPHELGILLRSFESILQTLVTWISGCLDQTMSYRIPESRLHLELTNLHGASSSGADLSPHASIAPHYRVNQSRATSLSHCRSWQGLPKPPRLPLLKGISPLIRAR